MLALLRLLPLTLRAYDDGVTDYVTIPAGSYIIDMGVTPQTFANGLKPYGLVYDLVVNHKTPVEWAINPSKAKDGTDFTDNAKNYRGGPFIVRAEYVTTTVSNVIRNWKSLGVVVDGPIASAIANVPIYDTITALAKLALDTANGSITAAYLNNAGIPASAYSLKTPAQLTACEDFFALPHADPTWSTHSNLVNFVAAGGYLWSACHAVSVLEAIDSPLDPDTSPDMNFLSVNGLLNYGLHGDGTPPYTYDTLGDADPVMQFMGILDSATQNGSEQIYLPLAAGWRPTTRLYVYDPTQADVPGKSPGPAAVVAYGRAYGVSSYGRVMYEGGHDHNKASGTANVAAQRAFLNMYLLSGIERRPEPVLSVPATMTEQVATNIGGSISGGSGSYTYQWSSSIGGTFGNSNSLNTTFTPPDIPTNTAAVLKLVASDSCGRTVVKTANILVQFIPTSDLSVTCADSQDPVAAGGSFNYVLSVVNAGLDPATNVVVRNTLPAGAAFTSASGSGWSCSHSTGVVTCSRAILSTNVGSPATITIAVTATNTATILTNIVSVTSTNFDHNLANNTNTCTTTVINGIDLKLTKTAATNGYTGVIIPYTLTVTNLTPAAVTNVVITDILPPTLDYSSASGTGWSAYYEETDRQVTLVLPSLGSNASSTVTLNLLPGTNAAGLTVTNTASVRSSQPDPDTANNSATNATTIVAAADLEISKSSEFDDAPSPDAFIFYIELVNKSPVTATSITVTDKLTYSTSPFPLYFSNAVASVGSFTSAGVRGSNGGTWTLTSLAPGASATLTLYYGGTSSATFTNTVQILSLDQTDPETNNNAATTLLDKDFKQIDFAILKTDSPDPVRAGSNITYTITATNTGTAKGDDWKGAGKTLTVTDTLPPGTTFVSASGTGWTCNHNSGTVTCTYTGDINHKQAKSFTLVVTAPSSPGTLTNTANLSYTHPTASDPNPANDSYSQTTIVSSDVDLRVLKSVDNPTPPLHSNVTFTVTVSNLRSNTATNVRITEALPTGLSYVSDSVTAGLYDPGDGYWYLGSLGPGASATLTLVAQVTAAGTLTNTATLSALTQADTNAANDSASVTVTAQYADLALGKAVSTTTPSVNSNATFTITITNLGPSAAGDITVSDVLPEYLQYVSHSASQGSYSSATGLWSIGALASNATASLTLTATILNWGWQTNTAIINGASVADPVSGNNTARVGLEGQLVDLDPGKAVDNPRPLGLGSNLVFTIVVTNMGPSTATAVELTDQLPTGLGYVSHSASQGAYDVGTGKWTVGTLASNAYATLTLTATNAQTGKFTNRVAITACAQTITNTLDDTPYVVIYSGGEADLYLTKTVDNPTPRQGDLVTYTVTIHNYGPDTATAVAVLDQLVSGLAYLDHFAPSGTTYSTNTGLWNIGSLLNGQSRQLILRAFVTGSGQVQNLAEIYSSNASDPDPIGNSAQATVNIITVNSISGRVFQDIGTGGGTANNGILDGAEPGLPGATLRLTDQSGATTYATATSDGGGYYVLTVPPELTNTVTLKVVEANPAGHLSIGAQVGNTAGSYDRSSDTLTFTFVPGTTYTNVNFADVPPHTFQADSQQAGLPNSFVVHPHLFRAGSAGLVTFSLTNLPSPTVSNWSAVVHHDLNGNAVLDPGEPVITSLSVVAGEHVHLLVKDFIPPYAPLHAQNRLTVTATFLYTNASPGLTNILTLTDLTTVGTPFQVGLNLLKSVDKETALPGEVLTYTITYLNQSGDVLRDVVLYDQTPAFTVFHSATNGPLPLHLTNCVITAPTVGASGALRWTFGGTLAPNGTGTVTYKVTVAQ